MRAKNHQYQCPCPKCGVALGYSDRVDGPYDCNNLNCGHRFWVDKDGRKTSVDPSAPSAATET